MDYVVALTKKWNLRKFDKLKLDGNWFMITSPEEYDTIRRVKPRYMFFVHWSWLVPKDIYENYECVGFHVGDLPEGRGGSPIQNRIMEGVYHTKLTAFRIGGGIDAGDVYLKRDLCLNGGGEEIYIRASDIIFDNMIPYIVRNNPIPKLQEGVGTISKRRKSEESEIKTPISLSRLNDFVRMLDADTYPTAFIRYGNLRIEFTRSSLKTDCLLADARIEVIE